MKSLVALAIGSVSMLTSGKSSAQNSGWMNGAHMWGDGWMGGHGGSWWPILTVVVAGAVIWAILRRRK